MSVFAKRLKQCREDKKKLNPDFTQDYVSKKVGVARTTYTAYENGTKMPPLDTVNIIADFFEVTTDFLLGRIEKNAHSSKDEKDIAKRLEEFKAEIENSDGLAFDGEPMSDEAKESLTEAMEHLFRQTQRINKKYIPKKHRDRE